MDAEASAVEERARVYVTAAANADYATVWDLMSRGAQAIVLATARAEGHATENGPAILEGHGQGQKDFSQGLGDIAVHVVDIVGDVAEVTLTAASMGESQTLPFVFEDGDWKLGVQGLHRLPR